MSLGGGGGEARSLKGGGGCREGEIPRDMAPGGEITGGGRNPWDPLPQTNCLPS